MLHLINDMYTLPVPRLDTSSCMSHCGKRGLCVVESSLKAVAKELQTLLTINCIKANLLPAG